MPITHDLLNKNLNTIVMNGREVFQFAVRKFEEVTEQTLQKSGLSLEDISLIIPHQANKRILQSVAGRLNIPLNKIYCNIEKYGNMSSASIPVALSEACENNQVEKGATK